MSMGKSWSLDSVRIEAWDLSSFRPIEVEPYLPGSMFMDADEAREIAAALIEAADMVDAAKANTSGVDNP